MFVIFPIVDIYATDTLTPGVGQLGLYTWFNNNDDGNDDNDNDDDDVDDNKAVMQNDKS